MKTLNEYSELILGWAADRNLIEGATPTAQFDKLFEENGEHAGAAARMNSREGDKYLLLAKDAIGDTFVVTTILAAQKGLSVPLAKALTYTGSDTLCSTVRLSIYAEIGHLVVLVDKGGLNSDIEFTAGEIAYLLRRAAEDLGSTLEECLELVWNEIKDRTGRMIDGVFVKEADLA